MAGYVTQTRPVGGFTYPFRFYSAGAWHVNQIPCPVPSNGATPSQTTTSFRSSGADSDPVIDYEPHTWAGASRALRTEFVKRSPTSRFDTGHTFQTTVQKTPYWSNKANNVAFPSSQTGVGDVKYVGDFTIARAGVTTLFTWPPSPSISYDTSWYERQAIAKSIPTRSVASLATALGELLKDGLPSIPGRLLMQQRNVKALGSEHLNVEFALRPLINDVVRMCRAVKNADALIRQYERDSGMIVRRRRAFPVTHKETALVTRDQYSGLVKNPTNSSAFSNMFVNSGYGAYSHNRHTEQSIWFSGAFTYWAPTSASGSRLGKMVEYAERADHLLGLKITPEVLWELAPWSWLVDWVFSIQTIISNCWMLSHDSLVMKWAYLMCTDTVRDTHTLSGVRHVDGRLTAPIQVVFETTTKRRLKASPYGFGLNPNAFTGRQWGILAALGMTKSPRALR